MVGAALEGFAGGERALLVLKAVAAGADAGGDEGDGLGDLRADELDFVRGADEAADAGADGEAGEVDDLLGGGAVVADLVERGVVEAGEDRDGEDLGARTADGFLRGLHHGEAAAGVDGDEADVERDGGGDGVGDGLRDVVPLLVEEDVDALGANGLDDGGTLAGEELVADLEEAQVGLEQADERKGVVGAVHVEGKNEFVGGGHAGMNRDPMKQFAPAKINLYLHILGKRADGFHELETLMAPISLGDTVEIELIAQGVEFTCSDPALGDAKENLATRAAKIFLEELRLETGVRIHLEKAVPVGAGLGGGSSDAAAVLLALRELTGVKCDDATLAELAARLGSDVPFFIYKTPAVCRGRGELIEPVALTDKLQGLLVHPGFGVSTPWAYKTYAANPQRGETGRKFEGFALRNDLEPAAFSKYVWLPAVKAWFRAQPEVLDSLMSGSGSSVFALTKAEDETAALRARFLAAFGEKLFATAITIG